MKTTSISIALDHFTTFGDLLRYLRRRVGLTQRELSIAVGYSDTQISRLEQNERMPDLATISARFLPVLMLEDQPDVATRLLELAANVRREDAPAAGLPPYKGLYFFDEADAEMFFGREALTTKLVEKLITGVEADHRFMAIIGASGSGKSSLVRAGMIPALRWQQPSSGWPVYVMTPSAHPLEALAETLNIQSGSPQSNLRLADDFASHTQGLTQYLTRITDGSGAAHTLLVIDQFEELFTLCRNEAEQAAFIDNLLTAALQPGGVAIILIVMRADFYAHCAHYDMLREALPQRQVYIGRMTNEGLRQVIEEPARIGHWVLEPGLTDLLLHDVGADEGQLPEPGALPLLSHALLETWRRRRGRTLTISGYTASGGVRGAITETAEAVFYDQLESEQREVARQIFLRLTELGGDASTADTRRRVSIDELSFKYEDKRLVQVVLKTLADARLVTIEQDTAEVAHEALIRAWPTLRSWLEEDREGLRLHRHLTEAARDWDLTGRDPSGLYRGARLAQAQEWVETHSDDLNLLERSFLEASQSLAEKEAAEREAQRQRELDAARQLAEIERSRAEEQSLNSRRLRQRAVVLVIALIVAGVLGVTAFWAWQGAVQANRLANSRELAAAAVNNLQVDPERSTLLALHALDEAETLEARNALHQAVPELHLLLNVSAHSVGVPDVAYSPDGKLIASIGPYDGVKVWGANSGELLRTFETGTDEIGATVAFSPDGSTLAAASVTQVVLWDTQSGETKFRLSGQSVGTTIGYNLGVGQISFSPDGKRLAVANLDGLPRVWDLATQREILSLQAEMQPAKAIAYSADGSLLATGGDEGIVRVWNANDGKEIFSLSLGGIIHSVSFSPVGSRLAAASEDGSVKVWEAATGEEVLRLPRISGLYDIAYLTDERFATAGQDGTARVWDVESGQELLTLSGGTSTVISVAGSPDGRRIATGAYDGSLRVWDASPGREVLTLPGHTGIAWDVAYSPDGSRIASASVDGFARLWDAETGELLLALPQGDVPSGGFTGLAFDPQGLRLATGSVDGTVTIWDSQTGERLNSLKGHSNMVVGLAFSPDGTRLASAGWDGMAIVWDLASGDEITSFQAHTIPAIISDITFSLDGKTIFIGIDLDTCVYQWDAATGQEVRVFSGEGKEIYGIALSPHGNLLAMGNQDGDIVLWNVESGEKVKVLSGHAGLVVRLAFDQDGSRLASAGFDRLAKVWEVNTGNELFTLYGNTSNVFGVAFSADGSRLATTGADGTLRIFTLQMNELVALAKARVTRNLTPEECQKYLHGDCP